MDHFLFQVAYTPESWNTQVQTQENVVDRISPMVNSLGGKIETTYYAFGEYDLIALAEFPSDEAASAFSLAASAGGAVKAIKTTPLMTVEQGQRAMKQAAEAGTRYHPPIPRKPSGRLSHGGNRQSSRDAETAFPPPSRGSDWSGNERRITDHCEPLAPHGAGGSAAPHQRPPTADDLWQKNRPIASESNLGQE